MNEFQIALLAGALLTGLASWRLPRAWAWICVGAAAFVVSATYARHGLPYPSAFNAACDVTVCLLVYFFGRLKWEMAIGYLFQASVLLSIGNLIGVIEPHYAYIVGLEAINWAALLLINMTVVTSRFAAYGVRPRRHPWSGVRVAHSSLFSQRKRPPFTQVRE